MRTEGERCGGDAEAKWDSVGTVTEIEEARQPLVDLRTRLVLWILCLFFLSMVYLGLNGLPL